MWMPAFAGMTAKGLFRYSRKGLSYFGQQLSARARSAAVRLVAYRIAGGRFHARLNAAARASCRCFQGTGQG